MKKTILTFALAMVMTAGFSAMAQTPESADAQKTECAAKKECRKEAKHCKKECKKECKKADKRKCDKKKECRKGDRKKCDKMRNGKKCDRKNPAFKGIELSADQQAKLNKLNEKARADFEKERAKIDADREKAMKAFDKEVAKILNPDQLKVYEANKADMKARRDDRKGFRPHFQGPRADMKAPRGHKAMERMAPRDSAQRYTKVSLEK